MADTQDTAEWVSDANGNKCSVSYFGSLEAAQTALDSLKNCRNCTNCSRCSNCARRAGCSDCFGCSNCRNTELAAQRETAGDLALALCQQGGLHKCPRAVPGSIMELCGCAPGKCQDNPEGLADRAAGWLWRIQNDGSTMAFHGIATASGLVERAAKELPPLLSVRAYSLVSECDCASATAGFPYTDGLYEKAVELRDAIAEHLAAE